MGDPLRIPISEIAAYWRDFHMSDLVSLEDFVAIIQAMDQAILEARQAKRDQQQALKDRTK
jgi:hypothetical protein